MSCDRARRLFGACWDDELTHAEREWLEKHLAACPRCRDEYDAFSRALELVGTLPRAEAPPDLVDRVVARSRRSAAVPDVLDPRPTPWAPAVAAAAAVVVLALAMMLALPRVPWRGAAPDGSPRTAVVLGGPAVPELVVLRGTETVAPEGREGAEKPAVTEADPFDHSEDVEFILDPVSVTRGRATVAHAGTRQRDAEGERAIISF